MAKLMRLVTYASESERRVGVLDGEEVIATPHTDMLELIRSGPSALDVVRRAVAEGPTIAQEPRLDAPLPAPGKLLFCGVNFSSHQIENPAATLPTVPFFFAKLPSAVVGPDRPIPMPEPSTKLDYEVELAVIIGRRMRRVRAEEALDCVFGYTVVNDVSARDVQFTDHQITLGKGADAFCPMGPVIVTADDIPDPQALWLSTRVNGEMRQSEGATTQLFPVAYILEYLSRHITLEPGDVISTGTPAGVGHFQVPPRYLQPGDVVEVSIDRIGTLTNSIIAGWTDDA